MGYNKININVQRASVCQQTALKALAIKNAIDPPYEPQIHPTQHLPPRQQRSLGHLKPQEEGNAKLEQMHRNLEGKPTAPDQNHLHHEQTEGVRRQQSQWQPQLNS